MTEAEIVLADKTLTDRFWTKVDKTYSNGCWQWIGAKQSEGYGEIGVDGRRVYAHRYSYMLHN